MITADAEEAVIAAGINARFSGKPYAVCGVNGQLFRVISESSAIKDQSIVLEVCRPSCSVVRFQSGHPSQGGDRVSQGAPAVKR